MCYGSSLQSTAAGVQLAEAAGFTGWNEVEIFSHEHWARDQQTFLNEILDRYAAYC